MSTYYFNITYRCNSNCIFCAADHPLENDNREMSLSEFNNVLDKCHVESGDRVIINGGEPTVHKDFWAILDAVKMRGATIDLFTNGKKLADNNFAVRVLDYDNIHVRVPLFGSTPEKHDFLTGIKGNFEATTMGLDNLYNNMRGHATLEIKLLMSKATIPENEKIYELIKSRWNHEAIRVSLNPLLISDCVIQQKDMFIDTYEAMMIQSEPLIRRAYADGTDFSVALVPFCAFPNEELLNMCRGRKAGGKFHYASPGFTKKVNEHEWDQPCHKCLYYGECNGFSKKYVEYLGEGVMKPIT